MYSHIESQGTAVTIAHFKAQSLPVAPVRGRSFLAQPGPKLPPGSDGESMMIRVMSRIGSERDSNRLCLVGKNIQVLKSRLWEGVIPLTEQLWQEKGLDRPEHFDFACQHLTAVIAVFQYLNEPTVRLHLRDTFNYIYEHWTALDTVLNKLREEQGEKPVSVAALWTCYMAAHFEMMTERAHRWVAVHVNTLRAPLMRTLLEYRRPGEELGGEPDAIQWKITDSLHMLAEIMGSADFTIMIPMNGYKGYFADPPRAGPTALHAANLLARSKAYHERLKLLTREAISLHGVEFRGLNPTSGQMYHSISQSQSEGQNKLRKEMRGAPLEPVPREPWIAVTASKIKSGKKNGKEEKYGLAVYRLTYGQTDSEWTEFVRKVKAHVSNWGKGQTGSIFIKEDLKLHWLDGKELGIAEGDIDAAKEHFNTIIDGDDDWSMLQKDAFLVIDSASFASYTTDSYGPATSQLNRGDFTGFLLAIDPTFDLKEGIERPNESPGYNGQMRILGSLVWSDLYSLQAAQTCLLEDYWPLASEHPNMVYVGPTIPWQRFIWQNHSEMRWDLIRAVVDHLKYNPGMPPMPPVQACATPPATTTAASTDAPPTSSIPSSTPPAERDPLNAALRAYMLTEFQRYLRHEGQPRQAAMVDELLNLQPGEEPDGARLRQLVDDEDERQEQRRRDGLGEDDETLEEYQPNCPLQ
ncbi:Major facilitator superfamily domain general substrate transporter [Penicillium fimorum]|uniref:Major facilitator superfamily domain general substrate transporter n=1 Tax=Penicillium fimorum TaxID=1882269 RepID=A0A9W9XJV3_9EURO|nr:Major facilitator superfamily domain general substrate transporter [Penicillium fimorum]